MSFIEVCHDNEFVLQKNSSLARPPLRWLRLLLEEEDMVVSSRLPGLVCLLSSYWVQLQLHWPPALDKIWKMVYLWGNSSINNKQVSVFVSRVFISFLCNRPTEVVIQKKKNKRKFYISNLSQGIKCATLHRSLVEKIYGVLKQIYRQVPASISV